MSTRFETVPLLLLVPALLLLGVGCGEQQKSQAAEKKMQDDLEHAQALWGQIENYVQWKQPQGHQGWQEGKSPHGAYLKYYLNETARQGLTLDGAVIVKENYSAEKEDALQSVTVMEKRKGYDPETGNWFYVKYSPDGRIMENPQGMPLAGLVGKGKAKGCVSCHAKANGGDHLFMND